jgi:protein-S-isoprenylcysteine O-methyltransferase Ste14
MPHEERYGEMPGQHLYMQLIFLVFMVVWILDSFIFHLSTFLTVYIHLLFRILIAIIIFGIGAGFVQKSHTVLLDDAPSGLVTDGIMAHVRHPMYLGIILIYLAFVISTMSLLSFLPWFIVIIFHDKFATYEEQKLVEQFGEEYIKYKQQVPKWIPR